LPLFYCRVRDFAVHQGKKKPPANAGGSEWYGDIYMCDRDSSAFPVLSFTVERLTLKSK
jgi:hypothetical protein